MSVLNDDTTNNGMADSDARMYRHAIKMTLALCVLSVVGLIVHYFTGRFTEKTVSILIVGVGFWLLIAYGYKQDLDEQTKASTSDKPPV